MRFGILHIKCKPILKTFNTFFTLSKKRDLDVMRLSNDSRTTNHTNINQRNWQNFIVDWLWKWGRWTCLGGPSISGLSEELGMQERFEEKEWAWEIKISILDIFWSDLREHWR